MFSALLERMGTAPTGPDRPDAARASSSDSINSVITVDASNAPSSSSTPPTSIGDSASVASASLQLGKTISTPAPESSTRSSRTRTSVATYNVKVLSGTAIHAPRKYCKDKALAEEARRRRTISGDTLVGALASGNSSSATVQKDAQRLVSDGIDALDLQWSLKKSSKSRKQTGLASSPRASSKKGKGKQSDHNALRSTGGKVESFTKKVSALGKRGRDTFEEGVKKVSRELRKLADTKEYAHIDTKPVIHEVWSKGKLVVAEPARKRRKVEEAATKKVEPVEAPVEEKKKSPGRKQKVWLNKGLYAGQVPQDWFSNFTAKEKESMPDMTTFKANDFMPLPMWHGQRLLHVGRDFKLPFDVCSPLPPGQPKPDEWRKTSSNRFIADAAALWKKSTLFDSFSSKCVCSPEDGCDVDCQNRIMLYECDNTNCGAGRENCKNRAFADLQERRKGGGKYRIGVEVIKTADRGYGVRSNRCFDPHQIIVEYTGEIITEDECDRRMNEDYKDNECYYLMSFDQNMIIDATKGSIARFVNHSCKPNCKMVKWIVGGKPRMALFAGDGPIMTGDELTYDYNFDPFSAKNVQECRCGSDNCRGVLGPRPKDQKIVKDSIKEAVKAGVKAGKRKLKELLGEDEEDDEDSRSPKKRKMKKGKSVKKSASSASMRVVKGATKTIQESVSAQLIKAKEAMSSKRRGAVMEKKKTAASRVLKRYGKDKRKPSSRNSSLTIVAGDSSPESSKGKKGSKTRISSAESLKGKSSGRSRKSISKKIMESLMDDGSDDGASSSEGTIRVVTAAEEE